MKLEILSLSEAQRFVPEVKTKGIRIFDSLDNFKWLHKLEGENWLEVDSYEFDDVWPSSWKEYSWLDLDDLNFGGIQNLPWKDVMKSYSIPEKENLVKFLEYKGHPYGRQNLFDEDIARKIFTDFENCKDDVEQVVIHCTYGRNRSPAVGIAMNEVYGWGIEGLKDKFPLHRRFVYGIMKKVGKDFGN